MFVYHSKHQTSINQPRLLLANAPWRCSTSRLSLPQFWQMMWGFRKWWIVYAPWLFPLSIWWWWSPSDQWLAPTAYGMNQLPMGTIWPYGLNHLLVLTECQQSGLDIARSKTTPNLTVVCGRGYACTGLSCDKDIAVWRTEGCIFHRREFDDGLKISCTLVS